MDKQKGDELKRTNCRGRVGEDELQGYELHRDKLQVTSYKDEMQWQTGGTC